MEICERRKMPHRYQYVSKWERDRFNSPEGLELSYVYAFKMATLSSVNLWIEVSHRITIIFRIDECVYTRWRSLFFFSNKFYLNENKQCNRIKSIQHLFFIYHFCLSLCWFDVFDAVRSSLPNDTNTKPVKTKLLPSHHRADISSPKIHRPIKAWKKSSTYFQLKE